MGGEADCAEDIAVKGSTHSEINAARGRESSLARWALGIALLSRVFIFAVGFLARTTLHVQHPRVMILAPPALLFRGSAGRLFDGWANWDGGWYLSIARSGYAHRFSEAFFPLYPLLVGLLGGYGRGLLLTGIAVSLICFVAAALLLYRLTAGALGERTAFWTVIFLSVAPTSLFFQAVYTESLFLLLSVALFFFAERRRWLLAGLMGLLASLTRNSGVLLLVPLLLFYLQSIDWQWRRIRFQVLGVLLVPCGLLIYMAYLGHARGNPLLFAKLEHRWHRYFTAPYVTLWQGARYAYLGADHLFSTLREHTWSGLQPVGGGVGDLPSLINFVALVIVVVLIVLGWRRLSAPYTAYALLVVSFVLLNPVPHQPLVSLPRYVLVVFPLYMTLSASTEGRPRLRAALVALSLLGLTWLTARFVLSAWVA
jgi:hypothetical protein